MGNAVVRLIRGGTGAALSVSVTPIVASGFGSSPLAATITSNTVAGVASGGLPPYTYNWTYLSGTTGFNCATPTSSSTYWYKSVASSVSENSIWRLTVTDAASATATVDISIDLSNLYFGYSFP